MHPNVHVSGFSIIIQKSYMRPNVHGSTGYSSQNTGATGHPLTGERIKKLQCTYTVGYHSPIKRNKRESAELRWMNLEPIMRSEASQKEKSKYKSTDTWNLDKRYWWTYLQGRNRDASTEKTCGHSEGRRKWDRLRAQHWNTQTLSGQVLCNKGGSSLVLCDHLERRDGGGGRRLKREEIYVDIGIFTADSHLLYSRNQHVIKQLSSN